MEDELKPCPFCGGKGKVVSHNFDIFMTAVEIVCTDCGARTAMYQGGTVKQETEWARDAWNRRNTKRSI